MIAWMSRLPPGQFQRVDAVPLRRDDGSDLGRDQPLNPQAGLEFFKLHF
jgi:hypothetical protein